MPVATARCPRSRARASRARALHVPGVSTTDLPAHSHARDQQRAAHMAAHLDAVRAGREGPKPGDVVIIPASHSLRGRDAFAVLNGPTGYGNGRYGTCVDASAFLGPASEYAPLDAPELLSLSGGPCPFVRLDELTFTGTVRDQSFWRWTDTARAHSAVHYILTVPVWRWTPPAA